jgi:hypothetical protein
LALKKSTAKISRPTAFQTPLAFFGSARQHSFGFSGQTDLMPEKMN